MIPIHSNPGNCSKCGEWSSIRNGDDVGLCCVPHDVPLAEIYDEENRRKLMNGREDA